MLKSKKWSSVDILGFGRALRSLLYPAWLEHFYRSYTLGVSEGIGCTAVPGMPLNSDRDDIIWKYGFLLDDLDHCGSFCICRNRILCGIGILNHLRNFLHYPHARLEEFIFRSITRHLWLHQKHLGRVPCLHRVLDISQANSLDESWFGELCERTCRRTQWSPKNDANRHHFDQRLHMLATNSLAHAKFVPRSLL